MDGPCHSSGRMVVKIVRKSNIDFNNLRIKIEMSQLNLNNTEIALAYKSDKELKQSYWLFKMMSYPWLVRVGSKMAVLAFKLGLPIKSIVKGTIFKQFCGGETIALQYAIEDSNVHIISSKLTGLFRSALLEKITSGTELDENEKAEFDRGKQRIWNICEAAHKEGIFVHIDAEESWLQGAIDDLTWELSAEFNKGVPTVINALQMYRKDRFDFLKNSLEHARKNNYLCAVKLVRGAYMEKERARAEEMGYPSPICDTLEDTHSSYNRGLEFCVDHIDEMYVSNATHNEESCEYLTQLMEDRKIPKDHPWIATAQLIGMSDNISFVMANAGYNVEKYVPFGPVKHVVPYLIRRTQENTSVGGQMSRELKMIQTEVKRRKLIK